MASCIGPGQNVGRDLLAMSYTLVCREEHVKEKPSLFISNSSHAVLSQVE